MNAIQFIVGDLLNHVGDLNRDYVQEVNGLWLVCEVVSVPLTIVTSITEIK